MQFENRVPRMLKRDFTPGGTIDILGTRDQELETAFAKRLGVPLLLANVYRSRSIRWPARRRLNKEDGSAIIKLFEKPRRRHGEWRRMIGGRLRFRLTAEQEFASSPFPRTGNTIALRLFGGWLILPQSWRVLMKRTLTAVIALAAAAGFAGLVQAQTTSTTTTPSSTAPSTSSTAPSAAAPSATAPSATSAANPSAAPANPSMTSHAAPQASMQQPASGDSFWSRNISEDEVRQAQQQLQAQGLYKGPIDGKVGSEMHRSLARYQQQNGLRQTGTLDEQTVARIGGGAGPAIGSTTPPAGSAAAPAGSGSMTGGAARGGTAASPSTTSPIGAGGTSTTTPTTAPSTSSTQPVTR